MVFWAPVPISRSFGTDFLPIILADIVVNINPFWHILWKIFSINLQKGFLGLQILD